MLESCTSLYYSPYYLQTKMSVKDVTVYVPVLDAPLKIMYNGNLAIQDIIDNTAKECKLKNPSLASEFDLYGIFLIEGKYSDANVENHKQPLRPERLLSSIEVRIYFNFHPN